MGNIYDDPDLLFQSTPSARRATPWRKSNRTRFRISIHALREESDLRGFLAGRWLFDFNPRPPRGERRYTLWLWFSSYTFQSTPSARRATRSLVSGIVGGHISIHALREESDAMP